MLVRVDDAIWNDVFTVAERYERERPSLGEEFVLAVDAALALIADAPEAWPTWPAVRPTVPPVRRYVMARFPYAIGFQVFPDHVWVVVVAHAARRPGYWL